MREDTSVKNIRGEKKVTGKYAELYKEKSVILMTWDLANT